MTRALGWKVAAVAFSVALAAAFVAYRVASARPEPGTPPSPRAAAPATAPAALVPDVDAKVERTFMGGSKSLIFVDPTAKPPTLPAPGAAPAPAPAPSK